MAIHHQQLKKAAKAGYTLEEKSDDLVRAFWPERAVEVFAPSVNAAMANMQAAMALTNMGYRVTSNMHDPLIVTVEDQNGMFLNGEATAISAHRQITAPHGEAVWVTPSDDPIGEFVNAAITPLVATERYKGISVDGAVAYKEGISAADCPYPSDGSQEEYDDFMRWNDEWDAAADEQSDEDEKEVSGSVVAAKYRAIYAERGHPEHCGDWLATILNNLVLTKKETDIVKFEAICAANGVDTSKYNHSTPGWQGRVRMTGRNLLAKKVYASGVLVVPSSDPLSHPEPDTYPAPSDWLAEQRFNKPA